MDINNNNRINLVSATEREKINRAVLKWVNACPDKPVSLINYEMLEDDKPSMALSSIQGAYKVREYILGGYLAQYQFKLVYRLQPNGSNDKRLKADECLDSISQWLADNLASLDIGDATVRRLIINSASSIFAAYQNGDEDYQCLMTLEYEVM